jgi:hypothetical protein
MRRLLKSVTYVSGTFCYLCLRNGQRRLVGERGFEPPTPWSRTRCSTRLSHSPTEVSCYSTTRDMTRPADGGSGNLGPLGLSSHENIPGPRGIRCRRGPRVPLAVLQRGSRIAHARRCRDRLVGRIASLWKARGRARVHRRHAPDDTVFKLI